MQLESSSDPCASQALKKHLPAYSVVDPYFKVGRSGANKWKIGLQITVYANHALKYYLREQWAGGKSCRIRGVIPSGYGRARMEMRCENGLSVCVGRRHRPVDNHLYFRMFSGCDLRLGVWPISAKLSNQEIEYRLFFTTLFGRPAAVLWCKLEGGKSDPHCIRYEKVIFLRNYLKLSVAREKYWFSHDLISVPIGRIFCDDSGWLMWGHLVAVSEIISSVFWVSTGL